MRSSYVYIPFLLTLQTRHLIHFSLGRKAGFSIRAMNRMAALAGANHSDIAQLQENLKQYKEESARVRHFTINILAPIAHPPSVLFMI